MRSLKGESLERIEKRFGIALPVEYKTLLFSASHRVRITRKGKSWRFATLEDLEIQTNISGRVCTYAEQLRYHIRGINDCLDWRKNSRNPNPEKCSFASAISIADESGDLLSILPADHFSIWAYYHDGKSMEKQADGLLEWLEDSNVEPAPQAASPARSLEHDSILVEMGIGHYVESILIDRGLLEKSVLFETQHGRDRFRDKELDLVLRLSVRVAELASLPAQSKNRREKLLAEIQSLGKEAR